MMSKPTTAMRGSLTFSEELLLLLVDEQTGGLATVPDRAMRCAFAGALLMDLALADRIDTDLESLTLVNATPLGDEILDPWLAMIAHADHTRDAAYWIERFAKPEVADRVRDTALRRLGERGILTSDVGGLLSLAVRVGRTRRYPMIDGEGSRDVQLRLMNILFSGDIPAPHDAMLIALVDACDIFERLLTPAEMAEARERIELFGTLELLGRAVAAAIRSTGSPSTSACPVHLEAPESVARARSAIPMAPGGIPVVGHAVGLAGDMMSRLVEHYRRLGPVFRIRALDNDLTILAGPEANLLLQRKGRALLTSFDAFHGLANVGTASVPARRHRADREALRGHLCQALHGGRDLLSRQDDSGHRPAAAAPIHAAHATHATRHGPSSGIVHGDPAGSHT